MKYIDEKGNSNEKNNLDIIIGDLKITTPNTKIIFWYTA